MIRKSLAGVLAATLAAVTVLTVLTLLSPTPSFATHDCSCPGVLAKETDPVWGMGSDCTEAHNNAVSNAWALVSCNTAVCDSEVVVVSECQLYEGQYRVDVKIRYACEICKFHL